MAKTLSYINTTPRTASKQGSGASPSSAQRFYGAASGLTMSEVLTRLLPLIGENYADLITRLTPESYLYNPSFADDADGWTIPDKEKAYIATSDGKNRLLLLAGGFISQSNSRIRKPEKHKKYTFTKKEDEETTPPGGSFQPSADLVTDPVVWADLEEPEKFLGKEEIPDTLYLSISYICKEPGMLNVGFPESDQTSATALAFQTIPLEASENVQTISAEGSWDGYGPFVISLSGGQVEIVSLSLLGDPVDELTAQTDSFADQTVENFKNIFDFAKQAISRMALVQSHVNQLYSNDAVLKVLISDLNVDVKAMGRQISALNSSLESVLQNISDIGKELESAQGSISGHEERLSGLDQWTLYFDKALDSAKNSIADLEKRVSKLEKTGDT